MGEFFERIRSGRVARDVIRGVIDFLIPNECLVCGAALETPRQGPVRGGALQHVLCRPNSIRLPGGLTIHNRPICPNCAAQLVDLDRVEWIGSPPLSAAAPFYTSSNLLELIRLLKFRRYTSLLGPLAESWQTPQPGLWT